MGLDDLIGKAEELAKEHSGLIEQGVQKGADLAKDKVDGHDDQIDQAVNAVEGFLGKQN
jgi:hypothetical protein